MAQRQERPVPSRDYPNMVLLRVWGWLCERCGWTWQPRAAGHYPHVCPKCKSPYWDTPRDDRSTP